MTEFLNPPSITKKSSESEVTFVQISDQLMNQGDDGDWIKKYYQTSYETMPGYHMPPHYMEIPFWIPRIAGMMGDRFEKDLHVVTNVNESARYLADKPGLLMYSTMEVTLEDTKRLVSQTPNKEIIMGGYVDPDEFDAFQNVTFVNGLDELPRHLSGIDVTAPPNNELFRGESVIPRLTLSAGCLYACEFCEVPRKLTVMSPAQVDRQIAALEPLDFNLIYLDDKTFSQADNWRYLEQVGKEVSSFNSSFEGFIVQTTANVAAIPGRIEEFKSLGVKYVELGVESVNETTIRALNKPYRLKHLEKATQAIRELGLKLIPNLIFGMPGEDYDNIIRWVDANRDIIPVVNMNFLSVLHNAPKERRQTNMPLAKDRGDLDQTAYEKSWLTAEEEARMLQAVRAIFYITSGNDFCPDERIDQLGHISAEEIALNAIRKRG